MNSYAAYDVSGNWLGNVKADSKFNALVEAKKQYPTAVTVVLVKEAV